MAMSNYTALIEQLKTIRIGFSDSQFRKYYSNAIQSEITSDKLKTKVTS